MASRCEIVDEEYINELKDKSENENTKKSTEYWKDVFRKWANERNFQANSEEYESDVLDETLSQFYGELRKENGDDYEPDGTSDWLLESNASITGEISKIKSLSKAHHPRNRVLNSRKVLEGKAMQVAERAGQGKATKSILKFDKRRGKSTLVATSLERELHELCVTSCGGCSLSTLAYEGEKNTTKWK